MNVYRVKAMTFLKYDTKILDVDKEIIAGKDISKIKETEAVKLGSEFIKQGEVVAIPTETVYGLAADATSENAVKKIFLAKGRPQDNPLIVHIADFSQLTELMSGRLSIYGEKLIKTFWPGPLTIIVEKGNMISSTTTANLNSVAIRMPEHPVARAVIVEAGLPLAAPSANKSGAPSPTRAVHVYDDLEGRIPLIIDGGPSNIGLESTVIDVREKKPVLLRPGGISQEMIESLLAIKIKVAGTETKKEEIPLSPGMKYRHYSPQTPLFLIENFDDTIEKYQGQSVALIVTREKTNELKHISLDFKVLTMGSRDNLEEIAANIFALLRQVDQLGVDVALVEKIPAEGIGVAIMNRLYKASIRE